MKLFLFLLFCSLVGGQVFYANNFDVNDWKFGRYPGGNSNGQWAHGQISWGTNNIFACKSGYCLANKLVGLYPAFTAAYTESPPIFISSNIATIEFDALFIFDPSSIGYRDGANLIYSVNNGTTFNLLEGSGWYLRSVTSIQNYMPSSLGLTAPYRGFSGSSGGWVNFKVNLTSLLNKNVIFRFNVFSDNVISNNGLAIDNFKVYNPFSTNNFSGNTSVSYPPEILNAEGLVFYEGFDTQNPNWTTGYCPQSTQTSKGFEWGVPNYWPFAYCRSGSCIKNNLIGSYSAFQCNWIQSPSIYIPYISEEANIVLGLYTAWTFSINVASAQDSAQMFYSIDVGQTWRQLGTVGNGTRWYTSKNLNYPATQISKVPGTFLSDNAGWTNAGTNTTQFGFSSLNINFLKNQNVLFRIFFNSGHYSSPPQIAGFMFDDFMIISDAISSTSAPTPFPTSAPTTSAPTPFPTSAPTTSAPTFAPTTIDPCRNTVNFGLMEEVNTVLNTANNNINEAYLLLKIAFTVTFAIIIAIIVIQYFTYTLIRRRFNILSLIIESHFAFQNTHQ